MVNLIGLAGGTGIRYFTLSIKNIEEVTKACADAGAPVAVQVVEFRPKLFISIVEDPDGNWCDLVFLLSLLCCC
jgi:hypothetical protein